MILVEPQFTLLAPTSAAQAQDALRRVEFAGRICYKSEDRMTDDSYIRLIRMLIQKDHWSVLEHAGFTAHLVTNRGADARTRPASHGGRVQPGKLAVRQL